MEHSTIPECSVETGVIQEQRSIKWKISNFPVVRLHKAMINSQRFAFYAGDTIGMSSKWEARLEAKEREDGTTSVGLVIKLVDRPSPDVASKHLCVQFAFSFKDKKGVVKQEFDSEVVDWYDAPSRNSGLGFRRLFDIKGDLPSYMEVVDGGDLVVHLSFKIFGPSKVNQPLSGKLEDFEVKSTAKARADLAMKMMEGPGPAPPSFVKVIGNDRKEFWILKDILSGRSPVFRAMLETDMTEGNDGVIEIQDMGSSSLKTMLHFMRSGELIPEWKSTEVLLELTNAAEKYELTDLLHFLDGVLGDVCNLENVGLLIPLANRLGLKKAEQDLMRFLRKKGINCPENFIEVVNGVVVSLEPRSEEEAPSSASSGASTGSSQSSGDQDGGRRPFCSCPCSCGGQGKRKRNAEELDMDREDGKKLKRRRAEYD